MMEFAKEVVRPTSYEPNPNMSDRHRTLREIFPGEIGALDGTLVHAVVPINEQTAYIGRGGGRCYQNILGICDFDMIFTFVWAGWEGIAHDSRVLTEVVHNPTSGFPLPPPNKYYLCDATYANTRGFMAPYRSTRYWLADFQRQRALTNKEKFNHAHAQLRNVIERAYGVLKAKFPILKQMASYKFEVQRDVVIACFAIHNFIRKCNIQDHLFKEFDEDSIFNNEEEFEGHVEEEADATQWGAQSTQYMANLRDEIANGL
ncbi:putative nuclease HARBI1 [Tanacetum coccineum]